MNTYTATHNLFTRLSAVLLTAMLSGTAFAGVQAHLDRNKVYEGDPVTLIIESDGKSSGEPDLSPLKKDFRVSGNSTSTQVSIINGRRSDRTTWTIQLEPRQRGKIPVPSIKVGSEQTRALEVEITDIPEQLAEDQSGHAFLEVEADIGKQAVYVQQQIPYTVRLYYDSTVQQGDFRAPQPEHGVVEQLGEDKRYTVTRNGKRYNVIERHYAISAEKSGAFRIPATTFQGTMAVQQPSRSFPSVQDPFLQRFFGNSVFSAPGKPLRIHSKAITADVKPRPASATDPWLPAESIKLQDSWAENPPQFRVGEPVSRTITLQAKGLTAPQLPEMQLEQPEHARLYPETPEQESRTDGEKVYAISKHTFTYIAEKAGSITIPEVEIDWWNTLSNQAQITRLPEWQIKVQPGAPGSQAVMPAVPEPVKTEPAESLSTVEGASGTAASISSKTKRLRTWWSVAGVVLLVVLLLSVLRKLQNSKARGKSGLPGNQEVASKPDLKAIMRRLEKAAGSNDARSAAAALLELAEAQWPADPPRNLGTLAARLNRGYTQIMALDRALYSVDSSSWEGTALWQSVKDGLQARSVETASATDDGLDPLYPQGA